MNSNSSAVKGAEESRDGWLEKAMHKKTLLIHTIQRLQFGGPAQAFKDADDDFDTHLRAHPGASVQQVPELTDEQIDAITDQQWGKGSAPNQYMAHRAYARAIERAILAAARPAPVVTLKS